MITPKLSAAVISTDEQMRESLRGLLEATASPIPLVLEINRSYEEIDPDVIEEIVRADASLLFLDLDGSEEVALRFAQYLAEQKPSVRLVAIGGVLNQSMLLDAMRAGISEYLPKPLTKNEFSEHIARLSRRMSPHAAPQAAKKDEPGKVVAVFGAKGGAGATTYAINLAISLRQQTGKSVLLLDLDLEMGEIALFLGLQPRFHLGDMAKSLQRMDDDLLSSFLETHGTGVRVLPAPLRPNSLEGLTPDLVRKSVQMLKLRYDFVIVDLSRSFTQMTQAVAEQSDETHLVTQADLPSLRNIRRALPLLHRALGQGSERLRVVLNRDQEDALISQSEVEQAIDIRIAHYIPNDYDAVSRAVNTGQPVVLSAQDSKLARCIRAVAADIAEIEDEPKAAARGFMTWRKLFTRPAEIPAHG